LTEKERAWRGKGVFCSGVMGKGYASPVNRGLLRAREEGKF